MKYLLILIAITGSFIAPQQSYAANLLSLRSPNLQLKRQEITLSTDLVKTKYIYINTSQNSITETLVFDLPNNNTDNYKYLKIQVNDAAIQYQIIQRAISLTGIDISQELKSLGLSLNPVAAMHSIDSSPNRNSLIAKLKTIHAIDNKEEIPTWNVKTFYFWQQEFAPNSTTIIEQYIKPTISSHTIKLKGLSDIIRLPAKVAKKVWNLAVHWSLADDSAANNLYLQFEKYWPTIKEYCANEEDYRNLAESYKRSHKDKSSIDIKQISYLIDPKELWASNIGHFQLIIESHSNMYPILCWNDKLQRINENQIKFSANNYLPPDRIKVLYLER